MSSRTKAENTAPAPDRPPRGWDGGVWALRVTLLRARERLPYASPEGRLLDGVERYVRMAGRGRPSSGPWWANTLAVVKAVAGAVDPTTAAMLAPWSGLVVGGAVAAPVAFRPVGAP